MGVYIHIPFCASHCTYCGFYSELLPLRQGSESVVDAFVDALCREISLADFQIGDTVYFGGGTPSLLSADHLERILDALGVTPRSDLEMTIEVNPDDVVRGGAEYVSRLRQMGFNRVSMGIQSLDDSLLRRMGRRHSAQQALQAYNCVRDAGFDNVSVDFIFGFAGGDIQIGECLRTLGLPEHVSCYQLSIEPGSGLEKMLSRGVYAMPSDEECARQYAVICDCLRDLGYEHYEVSNWAKPLLRSRHNSSYWDHSPYVGFGPGAHSLAVSPGVPARRSWNEASLRAYMAAASSGDFSSVRGREVLSDEQWDQEKVMLGLRRSEGIPVRWLSPCAVGKALSQGNLEYCENSCRVRIPESKWFISDDIIVNL